MIGRLAAMIYEGTDKESAPSNEKILLILNEFVQLIDAEPVLRSNSFEFVPNEQEQELDNNSVEE